MSLCSRCAGTGSVSRGSVRNGVCFKCGGDGKHRPSVFARPRAQKLIQYAVVNSQGHHLAVNADHAYLEKLSPTLTGAMEIIAVNIGTC